MIIVKKEELSEFFDALKKRGARVDEEDKEVAFVISPSNPIETEYWNITEENDDTVKIEWTHTPVQTSGYNVPVLKSGPTQECKVKMQEALEEVRKKKQGRIKKKENRGVTMFRNPAIPLVEHKGFPPSSSPRRRTPGDPPL